MKKIIIVIIGTLYLCSVEGQSQCQTATNSTGQCIPLTECSHLWSLVQKPEMTKEDFDLLKFSNCGVDTDDSPMVCCQQNMDVNKKDLCFTPDAYMSTCIDLNSCPVLWKLLQKPISEENRNYLHISRCEDPDSVCCPPKIEHAVEPVDNCQPSVAPPHPKTECCGVDSDSGDRIFGGKAAAIDQFPWLALIEYSMKSKWEDNIKLLCGGVLISSKYVLTAGHCVDGPVLKYSTPINVRLGEHDTSTDGKDCVAAAGGGTMCTDGPTVIPIETIIKHRSYNPSSGSKRHDIALIRLIHEAPYTYFIRPICLPTSDIAEDSNHTLYAAGWGAVNERESLTNIKQYVDLPYVTLKKCQPSYQVPDRTVQLWKGQICAGGVAGKDSCRGDSGGPLMYDNGQTYTVVGIVSFGPTPCGIENVPGVYTKVYEYLPWIRSNIKP